MKKHFITSFLISVFASIVLQTGVSASSVPNLTYNDMVGFLKTTGIVTENDSEKQNEEISRIEFAVMAAAMLAQTDTDIPQNDYFYDVASDHWGKSAVNSLVERKIISGDGDRMFRPDDTITMAEAAVILVRLLHKEYEAEYNGGYPQGYITTATEYDVINSAISSEKLTYADAVKLIFNALNTEINYINEGDNLLDIYHGIGYGQGQITGVYGASVNEITIGKVDQVAIGREIFETKTEWLYERLGVNVKYFYTSDDSGCKTLIYVSEDNNSKNEIIEISSEDYIGYSEGYVEYYTDKENNKKRRLNISNGVTVLRNGQNLSSDLSVALDDFYGTMKLIRAKSDTDFDIVIIEDYKNINVGYIDTAKKTIYDEENPALSISLDEDAYDMISYIDTDGKSSSFDRISVGNIVSIASAENGYFAKLIISSLTVTGTIKSVDNSDSGASINIDGTDYEFDDRYYNSFSPIVTIGENVTIRLDAFGKGAGGSLKKSEKYKFAYIIDACCDNEVATEERVLIKMFNEDGEMLRGVCSDKVIIDSVAYTANKAIIGALSVAGTVKSQLVRVRVNSENEISEIDTSVPDKEYSLHLMENEKNIYKHWTNLIGYKAYVPTTVKVMVVPEEGTEKTATNDRFQIKTVSAIPSGRESRIDLYQLEKDSLDIDFVVYYTTLSSNVDAYASLQVVEKITNGLNGEGEPAMVFQLDGSGTSVMYPISSDYVIKSDSYSNIDPKLIGKGDIIRIALNHRNEITAIQLVLDYSVAKADGDNNFFDNSLNPAFRAVNGVAEGNFFDGRKISYGYVSRTSGNLIQWGYEKPGDVNEIYNVTFDSNKAKILIYDEEDLSDSCKLGSVKDIIGYYSSNSDFSKLVAVSKSAIISNMVVYR